MPQTFEFLGFTHYCSERRNGSYRVKRKTSSKKFKASLQRVKEWLIINMHTPLKILVEKLNKKLVGYYRYYGITDNFYALKSYRDAVQRQLFWVLNRRSQTGSYSWETYNQMKKTYPIARPKIYVNMFELKPRTS